MMCRLLNAQAPEVFERSYGRSADLWSVGMLVYHMLSGRFPWWCAPAPLIPTSIPISPQRISHRDNFVTHTHIGYNAHPTTHSSTHGPLAYGRTQHDVNLVPAGKRWRSARKAA